MMYIYLTIITECYIMDKISSIPCNLFLIMTANNVIYVVGSIVFVNPNVISKLAASIM